MSLDQLRSRFGQRGPPVRRRPDRGPHPRRPRRARSPPPRSGLQTGHHHLGLPLPGAQRRPLLPRRRVADHRPSGGQRPGDLLAQHGQLLQRPRPTPRGRPEHLARRTAAELQAAAAAEWKWNGRSVFVADGSYLSMPDTPENRATYPQPVVQQPGIGFPMARVAVLLSLATGACHDLAIAPYAGKGTGETTLLRRMYARCRRRRGPGRRPVRQLLPRLRTARPRHRLVARVQAERVGSRTVEARPDGDVIALASAQQAARDDRRAVPPLPEGVCRCVR